MNRAVALLVEVCSKLDALSDEIRGLRACMENGKSDSPEFANYTTRASQADGLLDLAQIRELLGVGERTLRRERAAPGFPPPTLPGRRPRWRRSVIDEWIATRGAR